MFRQGPALMRIVPGQGPALPQIAKKPLQQLQDYPMITIQHFLDVYVLHQPTSSYRVGYRQVQPQRRAQAWARRAHPLYSQLVERLLQYLVVDHALFVRVPEEVNLHAEYSCPSLGLIRTIRNPRKICQMPASIPFAYAQRLQNGHPVFGPRQLH